MPTLNNQILLFIESFKVEHKLAEMKQAVILVSGCNTQCYNTQCQTANAIIPKVTYYPRPKNSTSRNNLTEDHKKNHRGSFLVA